MRTVYYTPVIPKMGELTHWVWFSGLRGRKFVKLNLGGENITKERESTSSEIDCSFNVDELGFNLNYLLCLLVCFTHSVCFHFMWIFKTWIVNWYFFKTWRKLEQFLFRYIIENSFEARNLWELQKIIKTYFKVRTWMFGIFLLRNIRNR